MTVTPASATPGPSAAAAAAAVRGSAKIGSIQTVISGAISALRHGDAAAAATQ